MVTKHNAHLVCRILYFGACRNTAYYPLARVLIAARDIFADDSLLLVGQKAFDIFICFEGKVAAKMIRHDAA